LTESRKDKAMNVDDYRKQVEVALAAESAAPSEPGMVARFLAFLTRARGRATRKSLDPETSAGDIGAMIATLRDPAADQTARLNAIDALGAARFMGPQFAPYEEQYRDALRQVATDPDERVRRRALEVLALEADSYARDLLVESLRGPDQALVSDAKAIQLLGHDAHGDYAPLIREMIERGVDEAALAEGLRLLASDPGSAEMFEGLLRDRSAPRFVRKLAAKGLQVVRPEAFEAAAREIVADDDEDDDLRAAVLSALGHAGDQAAARADPEFAARVEQVASSTPSENLRETAQQFIKSSEAGEERPLDAGA
jgi:hypothetical protein